MSKYRRDTRSNVLTRERTLNALSASGIIVLGSLMGYSLCYQDRPFVREGPFRGIETTLDLCDKELRGVSLGDTSTLRLVGESLTSATHDLTNVADSLKQLYPTEYAQLRHRVDSLQLVCLGLVN